MTGSVRHVAGRVGPLGRLSGLGRTLTLVGALALAAGVCAPAGAAAPTVAPNAAAGKVAPSTAAGKVAPSAGAAALRATAPAEQRSSGYHATPQTRILDTSTGVGGVTGPVCAGCSIEVHLFDRDDVPRTGVGALALNVTVSDGTANSYLTLFPTGGTVPTVPQLYFPASAAVSGLVVTPMSTSGSVTIRNQAGGAQVRIELNGWYDSGSWFTPVTPTRILDTRSGLGAPKAAVGAGKTVNLKVAGNGGIPATGVEAVAMNVTGVSATAATGVTVYPTGSTRPTRANLYLQTGRTGSALVIGRLDSGGRTTLFNQSGTVQLLADVTGWYAANGQFTPVAPTRVLDTPAGRIPMTANTSRTVRVSGCCTSGRGDSYAALVQVTAVSPTATGYLSITPGDGYEARTVSLAAGRTASNLALVALTDGALVVYNSAGQTGVTIDVLAVMARPITLTTGIGAFGTATVAAPFYYPMDATGEPDLTFSTSGALPPGVRLDPVAGRPALTGTPTTSGTWTVVTRATDAYGQTARNQVDITVAPAVPGRVWGWGDNRYGAVGTANTFPNLQQPEAADGLSGVTDVVSTQKTACALMADTTVRCWGENPDGQLGDGTASNTVIYRRRPGPVTGLSGVKALAANYSQIFALKSDGTVWGWGATGPGYGLGQSEGTAQLTPVRVEGLSDITAIATAGFPGRGGYAVRSDGTAWAWGGVPTGGAVPEVRGAPVQVPGLTSVKGVAAVSVNVGPQAGFAMLADGSVWGWGSNQYGLLGDGTTANRTAPAPIAGLSDVTSISSSWLAAIFAVTEDGSVWAWGNNTYGQFGNGGTSTTVVRTRQRVAGLPPVTRVAVGERMVYALTTDHQVWSWGKAQSVESALGISGPKVDVARLTPGVADLVPPADRIAAARATGFAVGRP
jgi:alpha-tubulin suppressor-like RCC1 family protein